MQTVDLTQVPVVDNHCHSIMRDQTFDDPAIWRRSLTESTDPGMARDHVASTALYRRLIRTLAEYPEEVRVAADLRAPHRLTRYAEELAARFHRFYNECRVVTDDAPLTQARLHLSAATRQVLANVLDLLGVSAPASMERLEERE